MNIQLKITDGTNLTDIVEVLNKIITEIEEGKRNNFIDSKGKCLPIIICNWVK